MSTKIFPLRVRGLCAQPAEPGLFERGRQTAFALVDISFELEAGEILAVVGESRKTRRAGARALDRKSVV